MWSCIVPFGSNMSDISAGDVMSFLILKGLIAILILDISLY